MRRTEFESAIQQKSPKVVVIGLGQVGLPLAVEFAKSGFRVLGFDTSEGKTRALSRGSSYIADVSSVDLGVVIESGRLSVTADESSLSECNVAVICVPTPLNIYQEPDTSMIAGAAALVSENLARPALVILESTSYPGTTEDILLPTLLRDNRVLDEDLFVGFSSERIDPGNRRYKLRDIPKIVAGITPASGKLLASLYGQVMNEVVRAESVRVAEAAKLIENVFRAVNIALIDEMKMVFDRLGLDMWETIRLASTKPFGYLPFYPGPGVGGECVPVDPLYLAARAKQHGLHIRFVELARDILESMPTYVMEQVCDLLNSENKAPAGSRVLLVGVAYKCNVPDVKNSPAFAVASLLAEKGCQVDYHDPLVPQAELAGVRLASRPLTVSLLRRYDCVVILTDHRDIDFGLIARNAKLVVDTRNALGRAGGYRSRGFLSAAGA